MNVIKRTSLSRLLALPVLAAALMLTPSAVAYSVLSHEEVVDMAWKVQIVPMLRARFPGITDDDIRQAHAYAYGGSVIQDIGYYPFGSHYFSDLLHYVRPGDFVNALIRDSQTPNEFAFALGALAHFCGDTKGHPYINQVTATENPPLQHRFGPFVTYGEDPTAHLRTEFGFDVVEVAHGHYSQENYRDFVGFQVSKSLLERAFLETYGIPMNRVIKHEDLAISIYRRAVSVLIPQMTRIAFVSYKNDIEQAAPGTQKKKFLYRLNQIEYNKEFGTDYTHVGVRGHILAFVLRFVPKVGPFKALKVTIPNAAEQTTYLKSINETVDAFKSYLSQIHAAPAPLPIPDAKDAADARKAADKVSKDADEAEKRADKSTDPTDKAKKEKVAAYVQKVAEKAAAAAARTEAKVEAVQSAAESTAPAPPLAAKAVLLGTSIQPPSTPILPALDLDTGKPSGTGEYILADKTYAHLLNDLVKSAAAAPAGTPASPTPPALFVDPALAAKVESFFSNPVPHTGGLITPRAAQKKVFLDLKVKTDLATLKTIESKASPASSSPAVH